ncbi:MAG: hypothetical protein U9R74_01850, partial [Pseudomonadota bacterium]|nr:hypothetical protein [Pseudomonadota bacterium]
GQPLEQSLEFATFSAFKDYKDEIESLVYDQGLMPLARRTYERFWRSDQPRILDEQLFGGTAHKNPPEDVLSDEARSAFGDLRRPGRPVTRIAGVRYSNAVLDYVFADVRNSGRVRLNGRPGYFGETFSWSIQNAPGAIPTINSANRSLASFALDPSASSDIKSDGSSPYRVQLSMSNAHANYDEIVRGQLWSNSSLGSLNFIDDIYPLLSEGFDTTKNTAGKLSCIQCHSNGNVVSWADGIFVLRDFQLPEDKALDYAFSNFMTRVNCDDPANSLVVLKPSGFHHYAGTVTGFANLGDDSGDANHRAKITRWIMEGAPYDAAGSKKGCQASLPVFYPGIIGLSPKPLSPVPGGEFLSR